jgi:hypothetical protein
MIPSLRHGHDRDAVCKVGEAESGQGDSDGANASSGAGLAPKCPRGLDMTAGLRGLFYRFQLNYVWISHGYPSSQGGCG